MKNHCDLDHVRVLCIGDVMLDRFISGDVERISPESPIPIIAVKETNSIPGGAGNVARNVVSLGGHCTLIGVVGNDRVGTDLADMLRHSGNVNFVPVTDQTRPTGEKVRYVAQGQQLLRVDRESATSIAPDIERAILSRVSDLVDAHHIMVLSDYAKGVLTDFVIQSLIAIAKKAGIPVIVDPKSKNLARYSGANIITPNLAEARLATGLDGHDDAGVKAVGQAILEQTNVDCVLLTRSERGMSILRRNADPVHIPTHAQEVYDVSGAGDTVVATLALAIGAGQAIEEAAQLANIAAGVVVGKRGTAAVTQAELQRELVLLDDAAAAHTTKVALLDNAQSRRREWRQAGLKVGFTNGCFDILHLGHARLLEFARSRCDRLILGLNSDASVKRLKGPNRPVNTEDDRAQLLAALSFVDLVVVFGEDTPYEAIKALVPDVLVKGADYRIEDIVGADIVQENGGEVVTFDLLPGRSTTAAIERARAPHNADHDAGKVPS